MVNSGALQIVPLTSALRDTFLEFFEGEGFADNPKWASCYCQYPQEDHRVVDWHARTALENRGHLCDRIDRGITRGYLALIDGEAVGWCSAGPRLSYGSLLAEPVDDARDVGSIMCFVVAPSRRGQGIARALLDAAVEGFRYRGLAVAEAYPQSSPTTDAANHHGPMPMFIAAGFTTHVAEDADGTVVVRKALSGGDISGVPRMGVQTTGRARIGRHDK